MTARDDCKSCGASSADKCVCGVHSCSYECERPACVRRQRDELFTRMKEVMQSDADASVSRPVAPPGLSSDGPGVSKVALPEPYHHDCTGDEMRCMDGHGCECEMKGDGPEETPYTAAQLESYAAARVAEATAELREDLCEARSERDQWASANVEAATQRDELQRRVAELEANDRRYRFLRDKPSNHFFVTRHVGGATIARYEGRTLDETIDAILADREGGKA